MPFGRNSLSGEPEIQPIRAVIFDAGLTLIHDTTPAHEIASEVLNRRGISIGHDTIIDAMRVAMADVAKRWHTGDHWLTEASVKALFATSYRVGLSAIEELSLRPDLLELVITDIYETYRDPHHWNAYPDVVPTLEALRQRGVRMGVISDWGHGLEGILLELELGEYFDFLVVSARLGIAKPDPRVFESALARLDVPAINCAYVGDTYVKDVFGARAAGLTPVLLDRLGIAPAMDCRVVHDLSALVSVLNLDD